MTAKKRKTTPRKVVVWAVVDDDGFAFTFTRKRDADNFKMSVQSHRRTLSVVRCEGSL